jgi:hypothetical protein
MLLLSLITAKTVQVSTENLSPHMVMPLADIQDQDNCRKKVINLQDFLQGPCSDGQRSLCLALCILSSLYGIRGVYSAVYSTLEKYQLLFFWGGGGFKKGDKKRKSKDISKNLNKQRKTIQGGQKQSLED